MSCRVWVGTSGYSYAEWAEAGFYPPGTRAGHMLPVYARTFGATELNYTWYQMPKAVAIERMRNQAPAGFQFAAKLTRTLTHEIDDRQWRSQAALYRDGVTPLLQRDQLAAVLLQFPPYFDRALKHRHYLAALLEELAGLPLAVEFRHDSWASERVYSELLRRKTTLVAVDEPDLPGLFPALAEVTNPDLFYVRFHGRNARGWRSGNMQLQFDYDYSDSELAQWCRAHIEPMAARARRGLVFFNNHVRAQAPKNARQLMAQLAARSDMDIGPLPVPIRA